MISKSRKRAATSYGTVKNENLADCPFTVNVVSEPPEPKRSERVGPMPKKRKHGKSENTNQNATVIFS
ncbi:hypothetical protein TGAMA5MH_11008 [Trichoderma gamsii]|uniref:Uncharacterized protein n=1 Tax=Trichoderma gamsii TaxID=398673 RepID=A0A2K0SV01_9HYPO|nr:hypothetical protein TGAMA5MH_11008 [Trichoderma gamsii]